MTDYSDSIRLLSQLPRPSGSPIGTTRQHIAQYSRQFGIPFPEVLVQWLVNVNGAFVNSQGLIGIGNTGDHLGMDTLYSIFPNWVKRGLIPVATNGCRNFYLVATRQEYGNGYPVVFIDMQLSSSEANYLVASTFEIFVTQFIRKEAGLAAGWPFDQNTTLSLDAALLNFQDIPLP